jgi:hypothetical protein
MKREKKKRKEKQCFDVFEPTQNVSSLLTYSTLSHFVEFAFDMQLRMFGFDAFQLYCHFFACGNVCAQIDIAK